MTVPAPASPINGRLLIAVLLVAAAVAGGLWYRFVYTAEQQTDAGPEGAVRPDPPPPDPRLTFPTPFRNVKPDVQYVGDATCASCHAAIDKSYHHHPMGRSATLGVLAQPIEKYDAAAHNPLTVGPYQIRAERVGDKVRHIVSAKDAAGNPLPEYVQTIDVSIGSGTRGRSYVAVENGAVWQTPLSWFTSTNSWDVSPGFDLGQGGRRAIQAGCLYCHVDRVEPVVHSLNRFTEPLLKGQANVGCERCHGPGALHVAERIADKKVPIPDYSIVNPKHLPVDLRTDVCRQCHLQGETTVPRRGRDHSDFRPGLPWEQFVSTFLRHPDFADSNKSVGQFEQMNQSKCFTGSGGKLDCTSCHDPHVKPEGPAAVEFFRARCLKCHDQQACKSSTADRTAKADNCAACHMPRSDSTSIVHASVTNHRVPRRPDQPAPPSPRGLSDALPVVPYPPGPHAPPAEERDRDYGIALARFAERAPPGRSGLASVFAAAAEDRLSATIRRWPGDAASWEGLAAVRTAAGEADPALQAARNAVTLLPEGETALSRLAAAAAAAGKLEEALRAADRLVAGNPGSVDHRLTRIGVLLPTGDWKRVEEDCRAALAIHPLHPRLRLYLAVCLHKRGDPAAGEREKNTAAGLVTSPRIRASVEETYRQFTR